MELMGIARFESFIRQAAFWTSARMTSGILTASSGRLPPLDLDCSEETRQRLPEISGGLGVALLPHHRR